jgi:hypothetical protein
MILSYFNLQQNRAILYWWKARTKEKEKNKMESTDHTLILMLAEEALPGSLRVNHTTTTTTKHVLLIYNTGIY